MRKGKKITAPSVLHVAVILGVAVLATGWYWGSLKGFYTETLQAASVFFAYSSTPDTLLNAYRQAQRGRGEFKLLIVPGHDNAASGTAFGGLSESDLTLAASKLLAREFEQDENIDVRLARTDLGYDPELAVFFTEHREDILVYRASQTAQMGDHLASGAIDSNVLVEHNFAPSEVGFRLWGINLWANEEEFDLILHVHFNDVPRFDRSRPGWPTGFAIYVPEKQFSNARGSMAVAESIQDRLLEMYRKSTLPGEVGGPTEDQELIAIGSNNSLDAASVLIEYAYIYEPHIQSSFLRDYAFENMARLTYLGVEDFLKKRRN